MAPETSVEIRYCSQCGEPTPADELARFGEVLICANCKNGYVQRLREGVAARPTGSYEYAGFWIRVWASLLDSIVVGVVNSIIQFAALRPLMTVAESASDPAALAGFQAAANRTMRSRL